MQDNLKAHNMKYLNRLGVSLSLPKHLFLCTGLRYSEVTGSCTSLLYTPCGILCT